MIFLSISSFRNSLSKLLKAKKEEYFSVRSDITKESFNKSFEEIFLKPEMVRQRKDYKIIKARLSNSRSKLSKRDGFRIIYLISSKKDVVCLFYIYPKAGSLGQTNILDEDMANYIEEYIKEYEDKTLICHDIVNNLSTNKKHLCNIDSCVHEQISCTTND